VELDPVNVIFGCAPFSHTVVVPAIIAVGKVVTVIDIVVFVAHVAGALDVGVNVYVVFPGEAVLIVAGDQLPSIPLFDVVANVAGVEP
jgi:hypothetical protein